MLAFWYTELREWIVAVVMPLVLVMLPIVMGWLLRSNRKTRTENALDHATVQERLGEVRGSLNALTRRVADVHEDVVEVKEGLAKHIGWHEGLDS